MYPVLEIDARKIRDNAETVSDMLRRYGMRLVGVAKCTLAHPAVVGAMLDGGAEAIGDARIQNLERVRRQGVSCERVLLRAPSPGDADLAVQVADVSLNSDPTVVSLLGEAARSRGIRHKVILMVDLGDLREGTLAEDAVQVASEMARVPGIDLCGVGTNLACYGGVVPTKEKMESLLAVKERIEAATGAGLAIVSGGNSANMAMVIDGQMPGGITELRIGESVLLGTEATERRPVPGCHLDAFRIVAEVIEVSVKPTQPFGTIGQDAFGETPRFEDRGNRRRAILALGRQDISPESLTPQDQGVKIMGASSDHLLCDVEDAPRALRSGSLLSFVPGYSSLLRASTSPFVEKVVR